MSTILVLGAGRSSASLIEYLLKHAQQGDWQVVVGDVSLKAALEKVQNHARGTAVMFDIQHPDTSELFLKAADVIVSLLPANLHPLVAVKCLEFGKHLITASYVSDEMKGFHDEALAKGLLFLNECGLDPGIDHMSAMQIIDTIRSKSSDLTSFESFTGGLIAPQTDPSNPWRYKFTWNPRNVVMAGQSTAKYLRDGNFKYIPYQQLFSRITEIHVPGQGEYEGYANRDSLKYRDTYGLQNIKTMLRGTLRNKGFCRAWNVFVQLGCCDDSYQMENVSTMTHLSFFESFLPPLNGSDVKSIVAKLFSLDSNGPELKNIQWSGLFEPTLVGLSSGTPAQILEHILNKKWQLDNADKDQIVMWHRFIFEHTGKMHEIQASLVATGEDSIHTAMAKTVGLPLAISAKLLQQKKISARGVVIPTIREIYEPILAELAQLGIELREQERAL